MGLLRLRAVGETAESALSWFSNTDVVNYFISNTVLPAENGAEVLTCETPQTLIVR